MAKFDSILETVGRTPVVLLRRLAPPHVKLYVKLEAHNPMGSIKDRLAVGIIEDAERSGRLEPGQTVIEATSGNTGIGLAMVCAERGYPLVIVMAENFSIERRKLMRFLGARVVLTPAWQKGTGMLAKAAELAEAHGWFLCRQFDNEANADVHSRTTAQEILEDFEGERLDFWVTGAGTGGTLKGVARVLREQRPQIEVVLCEPDNSPMLGSGIAQPRHPDGTPSGSHPLFRPHVVQGWTPDFIPKLSEDALALRLVDRVLPVSGALAMRVSRELAQREGILTGISGGAALAGALTLCESAPAGSTLLCMLPDTGERYLSTPLFEEVAVQMSQEELEISESTPGYRFDSIPPDPGATTSSGDAPASGESPFEEQEFVERVLMDREQVVVMFAFEWCEFCWSVRKLFARCGIRFSSIDIDSVAYQARNRGGKIRAAVSSRTGSPTIPQIFVGGEFIGGASEVFAAYKNGSLQRRLQANGVSFAEPEGFDPDSLLPGWVERRGVSGQVCAVRSRT